MESVKKYKNRLYVYKGGGYDGCFWEWNYFLWDNNSAFFNVASSGYKGIKNELQAIELIKENDTYQDIHFYRLSVAGFTDFCNVHGADHVAGMKQYLEDTKDLSINFTPFFICSECKKESTDYPSLENYHGNGGIGIVHESILCEDCFSSHQCSECNEYTTQELHFGMCEYCEKEKIIEVIKSLSTEKNTFFLEYFSSNNSFTCYDSTDCNYFDDTIKDAIQEGSFYSVTIADKEAIKTFYTIAQSEKEALNDIDIFLCGNYFTAEVERFSLDF